MYVRASLQLKKRRACFFLKASLTSISGRPPASVSGLINSGTSLRRHHQWLAGSHAPTRHTHRWIRARTTVHSAAEPLRYSTIFSVFRNEQERRETQHTLHYYCDKPKHDTTESCAGVRIVCII
ncbi:hypothetical protein BDR07DRAFT_705262 [Suillus spraguei]|nr:hypothetical protein BDR07DRAFT_705262 [Suillus spraguei]